MILEHNIEIPRYMFGRKGWTGVTNPLLKPLPGEIQLKNWVQDQAAKAGLTRGAIWMRLYRGAYPNMRLRRAGTRTIYVKP